MIFTQQVKQGLKIKSVFASNPGHFLHIDQRGLPDNNGDFKLISES